MPPERNSTEDRQKEKDAKEIIYYGWLWKQGSCMKSWKKRFFVLKGASLMYYDKCIIVKTVKNGTTCLAAKPKGHLLISSSEKSNKPEFGMYIYALNGRKMLIQADSEKSRQVWLEILEGVCRNSEETLNRIQSFRLSISDDLTLSASSIPNDSSTRHSSFPLGCEKLQNSCDIEKRGMVSYQVDENHLTVPIRRSYIAEVSHHNSKENSLIIRLVSGRDLIISCPSRTCCNEWHYALNCVVRNATVRNATRSF